MGGTALFEYLTNQRSSDDMSSGSAKLHTEALDQLLSKTTTPEPQRDSHSTMAVHALGVSVGALALGAALKYAGTRTVWPMACVGLLNEALCLPSFLKDSRRVLNWLGDEFNRL